MVNNLTNTLQEGLNLKLSLAPPSLPPHYDQPQQRPMPSIAPPSSPSSLPPQRRPTPSPPLERRNYKRRANDMSTTENHNPATSEGRRQRSRANYTSIEPPYPWSTNHRAKIHTMEYLLSNNILTITGDVKCKQCQNKYEMEYDLVSKFEEITSVVKECKEDCHDRAPTSWVTPVPLNCGKCKNEKCVEAVIPKSTPDFETINWLFLLLGQMLGCLKLSQLRYFCTHTENHRTGAKDRLVYLTYTTLVNQLLPSNSIDLNS